MNVVSFVKMIKKREIMDYLERDSYVYYIVFSSAFAHIHSESSGYAPT